jgi:hypothetical protein
MHDFFRSRSSLPRRLAYLGAALVFAELALRCSGDLIPTQANYDVWGGNSLDSPKMFYEVDTMGFTKLGTSNRTATFYGRYNYYVVAVKRANLFLDAAQASDGSYYQVGSLATGNCEAWTNIPGAPDGKYMVLKGQAAGTGSATYGAFAIFYNPGDWTSLKIYAYSPPETERIPPALAITSHTDQQIVRSRNVLLTGTASDDGRGGSGIASVKVKGVRALNDQATGSGTASWSLNVNLVAGLNTLTVVAADGMANAATNIIKIVSDPNPPVLTITSPKTAQRFSNAVATVTGKVSDQGPLAAVYYQINSELWRIAAGTSNWTATVTLQPGTNTFRAYAEDAAGNRSITNTLALSYVVSAPLTVQIVGAGTVTPNYHGKWLELGKSYYLTAKAGKGWALSNWIGTADGAVVLRTNLAKINFIMRTNLVLQAIFADSAKPVLTITSPKPAQRFSNAVATVSGKVSDNGPLAVVQYQINNGLWQVAAGTSNWTATIALIPGANTFRAYARDSAGNHSATNTLTLSYVVSAPLSVQIRGGGTVKPNYHGQWLEVGKTYSMTATAAKGSALSNWVGTVDGVVVLRTNLAKLSFVMKSNLVFRVTFGDAQKPTVLIASPAAGSRLTDTALVARGTASDNEQVLQVLWRLNSGPWYQATGTTSWSANIDAQPGGNSLSVVAVDNAGNFSTTNTVSFVCLKDLVLNYWPMHSGDWRKYDGPIGVATMSFFGGPLEFTMQLELPDDSATSYYAYSSDYREVWLTGGKYGWTRYSFEPPIVEATESLLLNGGTKKSSSSINVRGQTVQTSVTVKVSDAGSVTVPMGTYQECKRVDVTVTATIPGEGSGTFSAESYTLAPRMGMIRIGAYQASGSGFKFLGWEQLTEASVVGATMADPVAFSKAASVENSQETAATPGLGAATGTAPESPESNQAEASLEWAESPDGQLLLQLRGESRIEYFIEAGVEQASGVEWEPFWVGLAPDGKVTIPVDRQTTRTFYRVRPDH